MVLLVTDVTKLINTVTYGLENEEVCITDHRASCLKSKKEWLYWFTYADYRVYEHIISDNMAYL